MGGSIIGLSVPFLELIIRKMLVVGFVKLEISEGKTLGLRGSTVERSGLFQRLGQSFKGLCRSWPGIDETSCKSEGSSTPIAASNER